MVGQAVSPVERLSTQTRKGGDMLTIWCDRGLAVEIVNGVADLVHIVIREKHIQWKQ
jgi:hypothetical protein